MSAEHTNISISGANITFMQFETVELGCSTRIGHLGLWAWTVAVLGSEDYAPPIREGLLKAALRLQLQLSHFWCVTVCESIRTVLLPGAPPPPPGLCSSSFLNEDFPRIVVSEQE